MTQNAATQHLSLDLLKRLDVKVELAAVDWDTVIARRTQKSPPDQGGGQMFISGGFGLENADPSSTLLRANGKELSNGWASNPANRSRDRGVV
jgi:peptide/nickel transport system substrate-binding protein